MLDPRALKYFIISLLLVSCSSGEVSVCKKGGLRCEKISEILSFVGVESRIEKSGGISTLKVFQENQSFALSLVNRIENENIPNSGELSSDIKKMFLPRENFNRLLSKEEEREIFGKRGVFEVNCDEKDKDFSKQGRFCRIWFFSPLLSKEVLTSFIENKGFNNKATYLFYDLHEILGDFKIPEGSEIKVNGRMIVLEPFSFHVPYVEKDVAGVQLILVLGLFLISGFILGFWVSMKSNSKGKLL